MNANMANSSNTFKFSDIFKSSFLESSVTNFSIVDIVLTMGISLVIGLLIFMIYKRCYSGVMYSRNFNVSLIGLSIVTSLVIMGVTSNVVLSLGMVGALSIVRFRTAIKDPIDLVYLFWAIAVGIVTGAGLYLLSICGSIVVGIIMVILSKSHITETPYVLVARVDNEAAEKELMAHIQKNTNRCKLKSKTIRPNAGIDLAFEVRIKDEGTSFVNQLANLSGVDNVSLVSFNGELAA